MLHHIQETATSVVISLTGPSAQGHLVLQESDQHG